MLLQIMTFINNYSYTNVLINIALTKAALLKIAFKYNIFENKLALKAQKSPDSCSVF